MSIIIKGMDMPKDCSYCILANKHINGLCEAKYYCRLEADYEHCPLIEIVTCKDCKHRFYEDMCGCIDILPGTEDDFFCPYGERRADVSESNV